MKIQTTCGHGDAHLEGIEGLPLATRIRFQCEDMHLKSCHTVYSNGIYRDRSSKGQKGGGKSAFTIRFGRKSERTACASGIVSRHAPPPRRGSIL